MKKGTLKVRLELLHDFLLLPNDCVVTGCATSKDGRHCELAIVAEDSSQMPQSDSLSMEFSRRQNGSVEFVRWRDVAEQLSGQRDRHGNEML